MVKFSGQGMVHVHRLALSIDALWLTSLECLVIDRRNLPQRSLCSNCCIQTRSEDEQRIIAIGKTMTQVGTRTRSIVAVTYFSIAEMEHQIILVNHLDADELVSQGTGWHEERKKCD